MQRPISARPQLANRLGQPQGRRRPLISLTPLIDVVFILLVFFMLASSFLDWRSIDLNAPAQAAAGPAIEGALLVEIHPDRLLLSGEPRRTDLPNYGTGRGQARSAGGGKVGRRRAAAKRCERP